MLVASIHNENNTPCVAKAILIPSLVSDSSIIDALRSTVKAMRDFEVKRLRNKYLLIINSCSFGQISSRSLTSTKTITSSKKSFISILLLLEPEYGKRSNSNGLYKSIRRIIQNFVNTQQIDQDLQRIRFTKLKKITFRLV